MTNASVTTETTFAPAVAPARKLDGLFVSLTEKGMDRLMNAKIEHVICTSALAAFN